MQSKTGAIDVDNSVLVRVGANPGGGNYYDGKIDDLRIYDRVLSDGEVLNLAGGNSGSYCGDSVCDAGEDPFSCSADCGGSSCGGDFTSLFSYEVLDSNALGRVAIGDIDGDGYNDVVVHKWGDNRGKMANGEMSWYKYPNWQKFSIATGKNYFGDEIKVADLDNDGDNDVLAPMGDDYDASVYWYENLGGGNWQEQFIGKASSNSEVKDLHVEDVDLDGKLDVVVRAKTSAVIYYQDNLQGNSNTWTSKTTSIVGREGSLLADVDSDGDLDFILNGFWLKNPGGRQNNWARYNIDSQWYSGLDNGAPNNQAWRDDAVRVAFADIDNDGVKDIVFSHAEHHGFQLSWYSSNNPTGGISAWTKNEVGVCDYCHTLQAKDFDSDGDIDLLVGSTTWATTGEVAVYDNDGSGNFQKQVISSEYVYAGQIGDIDNDNDFDLISSKDWETAPIHLWRNLLDTQGGKVGLSDWTFLQVDSTRGKYGNPSWVKYFGLGAKDVTGDGYKDLVAGRYFYRNPGGDMSGSWTRTDLGVNVDGYVFADVDGDSNADVLGFALPNVYWLEAQNSQGTSWTNQVVASVPATDHSNTQGVRVADLNNDGTKELIFEGGDGSTKGIYAVEIGTWQVHRLTNNGGDGVGVGDINNDGFLDIALGSKSAPYDVWWFENPGANAFNQIWSKTLVTTLSKQGDRFSIGDINGDGRNDIILSEESYPIATGDNVRWFENPVNPYVGSNWQQHLVVGPGESFNSMEVADIDLDGDLDVVSATMGINQQGIVYVSENDGNGNFLKQYVVDDAGRECHGLIVDDLNGDGNREITCVSWNQYQNLYLWRNDNVGGSCGVEGSRIYKEFGRTIYGQDDWRVTQSSGATTNCSPGNCPSDYLPNPILNFNINDLQGAKSAEMLIDFWGGHVGTIGKVFRLNNNPWINIPDLATTPAGKAECYTQQWNPIINIPLNNLVSGTNSIEGDSGTQTCYGFNWGQWGWYGIKLRVIYDMSLKAYPVGQIDSHSDGGVLVDTGVGPTITASAIPSSGTNIDSVEFYAYYDGYDVDGDGVYSDYQESHNLIGASAFDAMNHIGTDTTAPYSIVWDTSLVPDQVPGSLKLVAKIKDSSGMIYQTPPITGLTLNRPSKSIKLYKPNSVPENFWVRAGNTKSSKVNIPSSDNLGSAVSASLLVRTWNGNDGGSSLSGHSTKINNWKVTENYGTNHRYSFDVVKNVPLSSLNNGQNNISFWSNTIHHGIEILWPGPAILVEYSV
jgi:hypothetical protein